ncbi:RusA family crossover junction endodeoxyribonuclease [Niveispirillum irakense]|uniref:RusA family crossover junction endodeoxyribonuclease n=1 Tax=Niveispirillum irakense TaxID=34011 RepID=UPI00048C72B1|nr:RusA family crossover junction endodeoxyribonuclease [Niveispirillum irakense]
MTNFEEHLAMERTGALAGLNPMFGEWQHHFHFAPKPYGNVSAKQGEFRAAIQAELTNQWLYSSNVSLEIILHVDVQTTLETDETADLDNYAKAILDAIKGPNGIMIDDTQVQSLSISWINGYGRPSFSISARGSPDDFVLKPQEFYEMPDRLWYPLGRALWSDGKAVNISDLEHYLHLSVIEQISSAQNRVRAQLRNAGHNRLKAYQIGRRIATSARGFHRSRIEGSFQMHSRSEWQNERTVWGERNADELKLIIKEMREIHDLQIDFITSQS